MEGTRSKAVRIGVFTTIIIVALILSYQFLKGLEIFHHENFYYVYFNQVDGLYTSNKVLLQGMRVGQVSKIEFADDGSNRLIVELQINSDRKLSSKTSASIINTGLMGGRMVRLNNANDGPPYLKDHDTLRGDTDPSYADMMDTDIQPIINNADSLLRSLLKFTHWVNTTLDEQMANNVRLSVENIHASSVQAKQFMRQLPVLVAKVNNLVEDLSATARSIDTGAQKISAVADTVLAARIPALVANLDSTSQELHAIAQQIRSGEGSLGKAIYDDQLYHEIISSLQHLDSLVIDLKANPKRYVKFSLF